ncbi:hypothetical protein VTI74DRAFT_742 [Chaetomium olivicolor]
MRPEGWRVQLLGETSHQVIGELRELNGSCLLSSCDRWRACTVFVVGGTCPGCNQFSVGASPAACRGWLVGCSWLFREAVEGRLESSFGCLAFYDTGSGVSERAIDPRGGGK